MDEVIRYAADEGIDADAARDAVEKMKESNDLYCPSFGLYKMVVEL